MTNERGDDEGGRAGRPATELERLGDRLAMSEYRCRQLEAQMQTRERLFALTLDELELARSKGKPVAVEELIEALRDACALVTAHHEHVPGADAAVERWIRTIHKARGRAIRDGEAQPGRPRSYRPPGFA